MNFGFEEILQKNSKYAEKVFDGSIFQTVKIGINGELYWKDMAKIKTLKGEIIPCDYDICPDYAYINSTDVSKMTFSWMVTELSWN